MSLKIKQRKKQKFFYNKIVWTKFPFKLNVHPIFVMS